MVKNRAVILSLLLLLLVYSTQGDVQVVPLETGWNLISLQIEPDDPDLFAVLGPIYGYYSEVWAYDSSAVPPIWIGYQPFGVQTLSEIHGGVGYWIYMNSPATFQVSGEPITGGVFLKTGWNLVGSYSALDIPVEDVVSGGVSSIWGWDILDYNWLHNHAGLPSFLNTLSIIEAGRGYWIYVPSDTLWSGPILYVSTSTDMAFGTGSSQYVLRIDNVGGAGNALDWIVSSSQSWIDIIEPAAGSTTAEIDTVVIGIDWSGLDFPETDAPNIFNGTIEIQSNGGSVSLPVTAQLEPVKGHYEGTAYPTTVNGKDVQLPNIKLGIDIGDQGSWGVLTAEQTPYFPDDVYFHGSGSGKKLILGTVFAVDPNDAESMNMFDSELVRSVVLRGSWVTNSLIEGDRVGDYTETIEIAGADPIVINGTFQLNRVAALDPLNDPDGLPMEATGRTDKDGDGLPDDWEIRFGLNPNPKDPMSDDAHANYDTDVRDHYQEYLDRTNPRVDDESPVPPRVFGTITDDTSGDPVANVIVALRYATQTQVTLTDINGYYSFNDLEAGYYTVNFSHPGFDFPEAFMAISLGREEFQLDVTPARRSTFDVVDFVASPIIGPEPLTVQFAIVKSTSVPEPTSYTWVFGDGGISTEKDPVYTFTQPGEYDVTLITNLTGGTVTKYEYVQVGLPKSASYMLMHDVQSILGGHTDPNDPVDNSDILGYELQAVIGTSIGQENGNTSSSQNYQLWIDELP